MMSAIMTWSTIENPQSMKTPTSRIRLSRKRNVKLIAFLSPVFTLR